MYYFFLGFIQRMYVSGNAAGLYHWVMTTQLSMNSIAVQI